VDVPRKVTEESIGRGPRWQRRKESRPAEILASALQEFVEKGYTATRLEDVARRAGVTKGTMYLYFDNKEALFKEMIRHYLLPGIEETERVAAEHQGSSRELMTLLFRRWWERWIEQPRVAGLVKLVMAESANFPDIAAFYHRDVFERQLAILSRTLQRGIERGEFRPVDVRATAALGLMPLIILGQWILSFARVAAEPIEPGAYFESHVEHFMRGLDAEPANAAER
jgi:AcrR family transcriptional regulator